MARSWGVKISSTAIHKHVQRLGQEAQRQQELRTEQALNSATCAAVVRQAQTQAPNAQEYNLVISIDAWKGGSAERTGHSNPLRPPPAESNGAT